MTIMREWRGELRRQFKDEYVAYIEETGMKEYRETPGNLGAVLVVRDLDDERCEVVTLSWWPDLETVKGFAGADYDKAKYYPEDERYLLRQPTEVLHYESSGVPR